MKLSETFWLTVLISIQQVFILAAVILFVRIPKKERRRYMELGIALAISLITEISASIGIHIVRTADMNLSITIFDILNFPLIALLFRRYFDWRHKNVVIYPIIVAYLAFGVTNVFFIQGLHTINSYTVSMSAFFLTMISMTYLFGHDPELSDDSRKKIPMHWISLGYLINSITVLFVFLWVEYLVNDMKSNLISIFMFLISVGIIFHAIICYSLWLVRTQYRIKSPPVI